MSRTIQYVITLLLWIMACLIIRDISNLMHATIFFGIIYVLMTLNDIKVILSREKSKDAVKEE